MLAGRWSEPLLGRHPRAITVPQEVARKGRSTALEAPSTPAMCLHRLLATGRHQPEIKDKTLVPVVGVGAVPHQSVSNEPCPMH